MPVTAIVRFKLREGTTREQLQSAFEASAPRYQAVPGLVRKYYLSDLDGRTAGGVYLFESRAAAERLYTAEWRAGIEQRFGSAPDIQFFDSPVIVDNVLGRVSTAA
jgi:hypothetical protein